jgi:hypothetical protein
MTKLIPLLVAILLYPLSAWFVFQWRNPLCNEMSFYRNFEDVIKLKKLSEYQP